MKLRRLKLFLFFLIIFLILFGLNKLGIKKIKNTVFLISSPLQEIFFETGKKVSFTFQALFEAKNLKKENQELKRINLELQQRIVTLKEIAGENKVLRKALDLGLENEFDLSLAKVISRATEGDFILINKGERDGIVQGMPVISSEKILFGRVGEVFDSFSQIILISNGNISFDIEVLTDLGKALGIAKGRGNFQVQFQFIPKEAQIREGDMVVSSRLGKDFPEGLLVGTIKTVKRSDVEPFLEGEIKPYFPEIDLTSLFVIRKF